MGSASAILASQVRRSRRSAPWVGEWLRSVRLKAETPIEVVARSLGIHATSALRRETGAASISADDLPAVLAAYGTTPERFAAQSRKVA